MALDAVTTVYFNNVFTQFQYETGEDHSQGQFLFKPEVHRFSSTLTVRGVHFPSQNCIQADIHSASPLPHMNLDVSEGLICTMGCNVRLRLEVGTLHDNEPSLAAPKQRSQLTTRSLLKTASITLSSLLSSLQRNVP